MFKKLKGIFQFKYPLNHLYIIFRLLGISAYNKRNKFRFKVCNFTRLLFIPILLLISTSHYFVVAVLFKAYEGYLTIPIAVAFLYFGTGCMISYINLIIKNQKICELMNKMEDMKKILEIENPEHKFGKSNSAIIFFWSGFSFIIAFNVHDSLVETSKYKFDAFWIQMAINFIIVMIFVMDAHFAAVVVSVQDLFKSFRNIFKVNRENVYFDAGIFENEQRMQVFKAAELLSFCKSNRRHLEIIREEVNINFGIVNFSSVTYTLVVLIFVAYSNVERYKENPYEAVKEGAFYILLYGVKLFALLHICTKLYNEDYKLAKQMHLYFVDFDDLQIQEEVQIFSLQLIHDRFQFNAKGFFDLNFTLALSMISVVVTYTIVLIQLQIAQDICK